MRYDYWADSSLKELHESIKRCLEKDDNTSIYEDKLYGVRELSGWKEHLFGIEKELKNRKIDFIELDISEEKMNFIPVEIILYDEIKKLLFLAKNEKKKSSISENTNWKQQAEQLEKILIEKEYPFDKIEW